MSESVEFEATSDTVPQVLKIALDLALADSKMDAIVILVMAVAKIFRERYGEKKKKAKLAVGEEDTVILIVDGIIDKLPLAIKVAKVICRLLKALK